MSDDNAAARLRRDLAALRYLDAVEDGDWEAVAALWEQAGEDGALADALGELSDGLAAEQGPSPGWPGDAAKVVALLNTHLPSAGPPPAPPPGPLTAGEVAARIAGDGSLLSRLSADDRQLNARLLGNPTPLPLQMGMTHLDQWAATLPVPAGPAYWRVFRHVAVLLTMTRAPEAGAAGITLAAARASQSTAKPPPPVPPPPEAESGGPKP